MKYSKLRILSLISGGGSTNEALIKSCKSGETYGDVVGTIASNGSAKGIGLAQALSVKTWVLKQQAQFGGNREQFGEAILNIAQEVGADLIVQLGWLAMTPKNVAQAYEGRIFNQHPGPLDPGRLGFGGAKMHGKHVHRAYWFFNARVGRPFPAEATVHRVTDEEEHDRGALLGTRVMNVDRFDGPDDIASRLLPLEHQLVIETVGRFSCGRVVEIQRQEPLIRPGEEDLYHQAMTYGRSEQED